MSAWNKIGLYKTEQQEQKKVEPVIEQNIRKNTPLANHEERLQNFVKKQKQTNREEAESMCQFLLVDLELLLNLLNQEPFLLLLIPEKSSSVDGDLDNHLDCLSSSLL